MSMLFTVLRSVPLCRMIWSRVVEPITLSIHCAKLGPLGLLVSSMRSVVPGSALLFHIATGSHAGLPVAPDALPPLLHAPPIQMLCQCDANTRPPSSAYAFMFASAGSCLV